MPMSGASTTDFQRLNVCICKLVKLAIHLRAKYCVFVVHQSEWGKICSACVVSIILMAKQFK